jgi:hypothetical protein
MCMHKSSPPTASSPGSSMIISTELKAKLCDPSNPSLKVVNTTESHICGIPKTIKPHPLSASPQIPAVSVVAPKQQNHITTTNSDNNAVSRLTGAARGATMAPVSNPSNKPSSTIAPQINAINQQQQQQLQPLLPISDDTAVQNYTFGSTSFSTCRL